MCSSSFTANFMNTSKKIECQCLKQQNFHYFCLLFTSNSLFFKQLKQRQYFIKNQIYHFRNNLLHFRPQIQLEHTLQAYHPLFDHRGCVCNGPKHFNLLDKSVGFNQLEITPITQKTFSRRPPLALLCGLLALLSEFVRFLEFKSAMNAQFHILLVLCELMTREVRLDYVYQFNRSLPHRFCRFRR